MFNRASEKLGSKKHRNPKEQWIIQPNGMDPVVSAERFQQVQEKLGRRFVRHTDVELLDELRELYHMHGRLSLKLITEAPGLASWKTTADGLGACREPTTDRLLRVEQRQPSAVHFRWTVEPMASSQMERLWKPARS